MLFIGPLPGALLLNCGAFALAHHGNRSRPGLEWPNAGQAKQGAALLGGEGSKQSAMGVPEHKLPAEELLAFDGRPVGPLTVRRVEPLAAVSATEVLALAARADWPDSTCLAQALHNALQVQGAGGDSPQTAHRLSLQQADDTNQETHWHAIPYQGIDGRVGPFHVLIGTAEFLEDAGIPIPDSAREVLAAHAEADLISLLVGAFHANGQRPPRRSLIGAVAFGRDRSDTKESSDPGSARLETQTGHATAERIRHNANAVARSATNLRRHLPWIVIVMACSAMAGLWLSAVRVDPGYVAVVSRMGDVVSVLDSGLHIRPAWPLERVQRIAPGAERTVPIGRSAIDASETSERDAAAWGGLFLSGDLWLNEMDDRARQAAPGTATALSPGYPLLVQARLSYVVDDPYAWPSSHADADRLVSILGESALRQLVAGVAMTAVTGPQRGALAERAREILQQKLDALDYGLRVTRVLLDEVQPWSDDPAQESVGWLNDLAEVQVRRAAMLSEARTNAAWWLADARRRGAELLAEAVQDKQATIEAALTHHARVEANLTAYALDPDQTRRRLLVDLIAETPAPARRRLLDPAVRKTVSELIEQVMATRQQSGDPSPGTQPARDTADKESGQ